MPLNKDENQDMLENMKNNIGLIVVVALIAFFIGRHVGIGNQELRYGKTGFPVNCRALITDNLSGYFGGQYTAEAALSSISRNCGPNGIIWDER